MIHFKNSTRETSGVGQHTFLLAMNRIVNGKPVDIKDYPFMVHMRFKVPNGKVKQCGAAILSETAGSSIIW